MHLAVVGSGPSGLFAAKEALRDPAVAVDVLERLPTPFGLVRYGVAPDHHRVRSVTGTLGAVFDDPRARFLGNVTVGRDVSPADLRRAYDAVVVATGAPHARRLGVPGEDLPGSYAAGDLVSWYNGHPEAGNPFGVAAREVAVIGAGNVALDIARVLLKAGAGLADTDVPDAVRAALDERPVERVHIVARRGLSDVRFSLPELLELDRLPGVEPVVDPTALPAEPSPDRVTEARNAVFRTWAAPGRAGRLRLHVHRRPVAVLGEDRVTGLRLAGPDGAQAELGVHAVVRAVGYHAEALPGLPFDADRGLVPHEDGRADRGLYVTGWLKRGPSGVIGANKACALQTVRTLVADAAAGRLDTPEPGLRERLVAGLADRADRLRRPVGWAGWTAIDRAEIALGTRGGRARTKITELRELLELATTTD